MVTKGIRGGWLERGSRLNKLKFPGMSILQRGIQKRKLLFCLWQIATRNGWLNINLIKTSSRSSLHAEPAGQCPRNPFAENNVHLEIQLAECGCYFLLLVSMLERPS